MVYKILRLIVTICLRIYLKKVYLVGSEHFKKDQAYFIACNHPAGFLEPLLLACFLNRDLHYLVRGDLFYNPFLKPLLVATNQIPIFRIRDGFANLRHNTATLATVARKLDEGEAILIFIEGSTKLVKRLRPLQKGMARMTFNSMEEIKGLKPKVLPVGMSFTDLNAFREEVLIKIGPPIEVSDYLEAYESNNIKAIKRLTKDTFKAMSECMVIVNEGKEEVYESLSKVWRTSLELPFSPIVLSDPERISKEISISHAVNNLTPDLANELESKAKVWMEKFDKVKSHGNVFLSLPAFTGYIFNYLPAKMGVWFADRNIENMAFYSAIRMVVSLVSFLIFYIVITILCALSGVVYLLIPILGVVLGLVYLYFIHSKFERKKKNISEDMVNERNIILKELNLT